MHILQTFTMGYVYEFRDSYMDCIKYMIAFDSSYNTS